MDRKRNKTHQRREHDVLAKLEQFKSNLRSAVMTPIETKSENVCPVNLFSGGIPIHADEFIDTDSGWLSHRVQFQKRPQDYDQMIRTDHMNESMLDIFDPKEPTKLLPSSVSMDSPSMSMSMSMSARNPDPNLKVDHKIMKRVTTHLHLPKKTSFPMSMSLAGLPWCQSRSRSPQCDSSIGLTDEQVDEWLNKTMNPHITNNDNAHHERQHEHEHPHEHERPCHEQHQHQHQQRRTRDRSPKHKYRARKRSRSRDRRRQ
jgi:hypothetical protein